jgi:presenilin-like A22 family membrane protease
MDQRKRFFVAMVFYAVLALLAWLVMDSSSVAVGSGQVSIRGLTFALLAFFAVRTIFLWRARINGEERKSIRRWRF